MKKYNYTKITNKYNRNYELHSRFYLTIIGHFCPIFAVPKVKPAVRELAIAFLIKKIVF